MAKKRFPFFVFFMFFGLTTTDESRQAIRSNRQQMALGRDIASRLVDDIILTTTTNYSFFRRDFNAARFFVCPILSSTTSARQMGHRMNDFSPRALAVPSMHATQKV